MKQHIATALPAAIALRFVIAIVLIFPVLVPVKHRIKVACPNVIFAIDNESKMIMKIKYLFILVFIPTISIGSIGSTHATSTAQCPSGDKLQGWNKLIAVSQGTEVVLGKCSWTSAINQGGISITASGHTADGTPISGTNSHVSNNGWKTTTTFTGWNNPCRMSGYVFFALDPNTSDAPNCQYYVCTSATSCDNAECSSTNCSSPEGEPMITLSPSQ